MSRQQLLVTRSWRRQNVLKPKEMALSGCCVGARLLRTGKEMGFRVLGSREANRRCSSEPSLLYGPRAANISCAESKQSPFPWRWMIFWQLRDAFLLSQNACVSTPSFTTCSRNLVSPWVLLEMSGAGEGGQLVKILLLFNFFQWILPWRASNETDLY